MADYLWRQLDLECMQQQGQVCLGEQGKRDQGFCPEGGHRAVQHGQQPGHHLQLLLHKPGQHCLPMQMQTVALSPASQRVQLWAMGNVRCVNECRST